MTRLLALALLALLAVPGAAMALPGAPEPGELGVIAFSSLRCEQGGTRFELPYPNAPSWDVCNQGIFRINADRTHLKRLTGREDGTLDTDPTWSPDGTRIAFVRHQIGEFYPKLMVMNSNGTDVHELIAGGTGELNPIAPPSWSSRGDQVAFGGIGGIFTVDVLTGQLSHVEVEGFDKDKDSVGSPVFSPDGTRIAFLGMHGTWNDVHDIHDTDFGIWIANADGSNPQRLTMGGVYMAANAFALSPDWRYIAFMPLDQPEAALWTMKLDGTEFRRQTDGDWADEPAFSPFGPTLFYKGPEGGDQHYVIRRVDVAAGGPSEPVTDPAAADSQPAWNPLGLDLPPIGTDGRPPTVVLGEQIGVPTESGADQARAKAGSRPRDRLPFMAIDRSGVRRVDVALARRKDGRCRFLEGSKLGPRKRCGKPVYFRFRDTRRWSKKLSHLRAGKYVVRFRTTDAKGNRTQDAKPRVVRLH